MGTAAYEIRVRGEITYALANALTALGWSIDTENGTTRLSGNVRDQAELRGILDSLASISLELLEVRQLPPPDDTP